MLLVQQEPLGLQAPQVSEQPVLLVQLVLSELQALREVRAAQDLPDQVAELLDPQARQG